MPGHVNSDNTTVEMEEGGDDTRVVEMVKDDVDDERRQNNSSNTAENSLLQKIKSDVSQNNSSDIPKSTKECQEQDKTKPAFWKRVAGFGLMLIILKNIVSGFTDIIVKKITNIHPVSLILFRSLISLTIAMSWGILKDQPPFPSKQKVKDRVLIVIRGVIGCLQVMASYFALQQMPLSVQKIILSCLILHNEM